MFTLLKLMFCFFVVYCITFRLATKKGLTSKFPAPVLMVMNLPLVAGAWLWNQHCKLDAWLKNKLG